MKVDYKRVYWRNVFSEEFVSLINSITPSQNYLNEFSVQQDPLKTERDIYSSAYAELVVSLNIAALSHISPALTVITSDFCRSVGHNKPDILYTGYDIHLH
jgi:hypothetical protein